MHITKKGKPVNTEQYFSMNIPIIKIRPNKSLEVTKINIVSGCGKQDSGKFGLLSNLSYEILDVIPFDESKFSKNLSQPCSKQNLY